jgi:hypothetical protein
LASRRLTTAALRSGRGHCKRKGCGSENDDGLHFDVLVEKRVLVIMNELVTVLDDDERKL